MTTSATGMPFDDILSLIDQMAGPDEDARATVRARDAVLTKPAGSLGRLEDLAEWVAVWQRQAPPKVLRPLVAVFAGNHGVANQGVSAYPASVTQQMVENFAAGGAAVNQLCITNDLGLKVFDLALDFPTGDITREDAMDEMSCARTIAFGMEAIAGGTDLLCIGEMGIANTTIAAAIYAALFGGDAADWCGRGTGVDDEGLKRKVDAVEKALAFHDGNLDKPLEVLRRLGGREIAAMVGAILAARLQNIPVIVDGFVASSAAAVLYALDKAALDHCIFAHVSAESAHSRALDAMGVKALFDFGMRLGEGSGAALAAGIVKAAVQIHEGMATFEQASVDGPAEN
ncbi:nicotinate-nucleotide--dimethylbenzimidazole phosphoribosyltransferase [Cohaesibacter gelatinilyticus]|uniref:Nicotinate-nucleotide--dimethylbenzimidazole phosphoribosyltransferase n=1 Tax=Cohaesibacter gelatinilyticus TaxID=372072 RepID=A0A285NCS3_9HYPH|nr:nicotinate-nucleotide--dimethylbenzimidazole phosphoribosyltransferase [Cohaesibacter gelatinilyticus]SNZ07250.1 nicotinate-nucleotide-dimethylbenzimidazole phosphoribosyltransferase [Cohaesibacter gelatinilyticus]